MLLYIATSNVGKALYSWDVSDAAPVMISGNLKPGFEVTSFAVSPNRLQVAFVATDAASKSGEVYIVDTAGSNLHRVGGAAVASVLPQRASWSAGGKYVLYDTLLEGDPQSTTSPYVLAADSGEPLGIQGTLSPDDSRVATYEGGAVVVEAPDGSNRVELEQVATAPTLSWSPDGASVWTSGATQSSIFSVDGQNEQLLDYSAAPPTWAPHGPWVAFLRSFRLFIQLPGAVSVPLGPAAQDISDFMWSPDATKIAFSAIDLQTTSPDAIELSQVNPALPSGSYVGDWQWSPDSKYLAYEADQVKRGERRVFMARPDGSDNHLISDNSASIDSITQIEWSPTSQYVAYFASGPTSTNEQWFVASHTGENTFVSDGYFGAWSDDGQFFAVDAGKTNSSVRVLRLSDKRIVGPEAPSDGQNVAFGLAPK